MAKDLKGDLYSLIKKLDLPFTKNALKEIDERYKKEEHFFTALIKVKKREKVFFKVRLHKTKDVFIDFKKEVALSQIFKKKFKNKRKKILFPEIISWGKDRNLLWYLKRYEEGTLGGLMGEDFGLKNKFLKSVSAKDLANGIKNYHSTPYKLVKKLNLYHQGGWWYWQDFNFYLKTFLRKFIPSDFNKNLIEVKDLETIKKILKDNKELLDKTAYSLCHTDLYPNNVLLTPSKKIMILDWDMSAFNNPSFDVAFIYLNAWRNKNWQKLFLKTYLRGINKNEFKKLFQLSLISLTVRFSGHCWRYLESRYLNDRIIKQNIKKRAFLVLRKHLKVLKISIYNLNKIL